MAGEKQSCDSEVASLRPTQTIALQTGSPAIDKGTNVSLIGTLTTDQRGAGYPRKFDNTSIPNATGGNGTDIGAFERQGP
jgi:hypothetical protein